VKSMYEVMLASFLTLVNRCYVYVVSFDCVDGVLYFLTLSRLWKTQNVTFSYPNRRLASFGFEFLALYCLVQA